ncbi:retrotransposon protein, putative, ty1-copia subclass [Tanacetum coccineum]
MENSKRGSIPMQEKLRLSKSQGASTPAELKRMQDVPYASAVSSIMYAVRCTLPDVAFAQNITSRFQQNLGDLHWTTVKNIMKYLRNTKDMFLTGYVFVLNGGVVDWKSAKQSIFATSSTEVEYIATYDASKEAVWVRKFISGLGVVPTIEEPINIYCDNTRAITIANESGITKGARHFCAKVHYLREVIEFGDLHWTTVKNIMKLSECGLIPVLYTVEFQKRGLPHCHTLLWIDESDHIRREEDIDIYISAELPPEDIDTECYRIVSKLMMHGPCGLAYPSAPCTQTTLDVRRTFQRNTAIRRALTKESNVVVRDLSGNHDVVSLSIYPKRQVTGVLDVGHNVFFGNVVAWDLTGNHDTIGFSVPPKRQVPGVGSSVLPDSINSRDLSEPRDNVCISSESRSRSTSIAGINRPSTTSRRHNGDAPYTIYVGSSSNRKLGLGSRQPIVPVSTHSAHAAPNVNVRSRTRREFTIGSSSLNTRSRASGPPLEYKHIGGAIVYETGPESDMDYDIILEERAGYPQCVNKLHPSYMSLQFPLLFIYGQDGYSKELKMYVVTAFCAIEHNRIDYVREHQNDIRNEYLSGIYDAINQGDNDGSDCGSRLILPQSFTGGPHYMYSHYLDALAICRVHVLYTDEFQKRGLPHCHTLLWIDESDPAYEALGLLGDNVTRSCYDCNTSRIANITYTYPYFFPSFRSGDSDLEDYVLYELEGKTFLWKTIIYSLRSKGNTVLAVASSGNASLLLPAGRTAHSRFKIPLDPTDTTMLEMDTTERQTNLIQENTSWIDIPEEYCIPNDNYWISRIMATTSNPDKAPENKGRMIVAESAEPEIMNIADLRPIHYVQEISNNDFPEHYFNFATYNELAASADVRNTTLTVNFNVQEYEALENLVVIAVSSC